MATEPRVHVEITDHVAEVSLTRADKHNALDVDMFEQIIGAAVRLSSEPGVRAAKRLYDESWTGEAQRTLALEAELQLGLIGSPNQLAAVAAGFTKEPAVFIDP